MNLSRIALLLIIVYAALITAALAAEPSRSEWFKSLMMPNSTTSCCDISDCKMTPAEWKDGQWHVKVWGYDRVVPPEKILKSPKSIDGEAYVCAVIGGATAAIRCFIPPNLGF